MAWYRRGEAGRGAPLRRAKCHRLCSKKIVVSTTDCGATFVQRPATFHTSNRFWTGAVGVDQFHTSLRGNVTNEVSVSPVL